MSASKKRIKGKGARDKGSRAERAVRDILRRIYPTELRANVQRIPMSGAGYIKGDVADNNDKDSCYEVKNQETLHLPDWWRQAKSQAGVTRTPVLVVTQAYRPYYFILRASDWLPVIKETEYKEYTCLSPVKSGSSFFDEMSSISGGRTMGKVELDGDDCVVVGEQYYIEIKTCMFQKLSVQ